MKMNSTSNFPNTRPESFYLTPSTTEENPQPRRQLFQKWLLIPVLTLPVLVVASGYSLYSLAVPTNSGNQTVATGILEAQQAVTRSSDELEQVQTQRDAYKQQYYSKLTQLENAIAQQQELQIAYANALNQLDNLNNQNQQLKPLVAERSTLKAQLKQLQNTNGNLNNQVKSQKQQLTALQNHLQALENQKLQLQSENQQLQITSSQLEALKPELAKAHRTIEQLSSRIATPPSPMTKININGKEFSVTPELATALNRERQHLPLPVPENHPATEQQKPEPIGKQAIN
jgi:DNA repair exonuclease SbcCD ATPase subunit